tara:strand:+ start:11395 stop:11583 length:189 start_codon:yes stop_codon:yes gene_type:complete
MVTIDNYFDQLEKSIRKQFNCDDDSLYLSMQWDSETYWIHMGLPDDWFDHSEYDDYDEEEDE